MSAQANSAIVRITTAAGLFCVALAVSGCNSTAPSAPAVVVAAPEPPAPGVIGAAIGRELDAADRVTAVAAQQEAVASGQRKSWRGAHGAYGFVEPGPEAALGGCRDYTHKIFIDGRPQQAKGQACKKPDGGWRVTS
jgi:surface antigen